MKKFLLCLFSAICVFCSDIIAQQVGINWQFNEDGNTEGWENSIGFSSIDVADGILSAMTGESYAKLAGSDISLPASDYGFVKLHMKLENVTGGYLYWDTNLGGSGYTYFSTIADSQYHTYEIPVYSKSKWKDQIIKIYISINTSGNARIDLDYVQIINKGLWPEVMYFKPLRPVFKQSHKIPLAACFKNTGDSNTGIVSAELELPAEIQLISGEALYEWTEFKINKFDTLNWEIQSAICGDYFVNLKIIYASGDSSEKKIDINITDTYWVYDDIWLSSWGAPASYDPNYLTDEFLDLGFKDVLVLNPGNDEVLNTFNQLGIRCMINLGYLVGLHFEYPNDGNPVDDFTAEDLAKLDDVLEQYKDNPTVFGYFLCDEPAVEGYGFHNIGLVNDYVREKAPEKFGFVNVHSAASDRITQPLGIEGYVESFTDESGTELLSYDLYPFRYEDYNGYPFDPLYYYNLEVFRNFCLLYDIPHFNHIQAFEFPEKRWCMPTPEQIRFQVWVSLAYGVQGFNYFVMHWGGNGFMDDDYKEANEPMVRKLNHDIQVLGPYILPLTSTNVYHTFNTPLGCAGTPMDGLVQSATNNADLVIGLFEDEYELEYMIIANKDYVDSIETTITLNRTVDLLERFNTITEQWESVDFENTFEGSSFQHNFLAGSGALFKVGQATGFVETTDSSMPAFCQLDQNYPNPFNPATTIKYSLSQSEHVIINIFDILGREVACLVDKEQNAGEYKITWIANNVPSGIYLYRIQAGSFIQSRKMLIIK